MTTRRKYRSASGETARWSTRTCCGCRWCRIGDRMTCDPCLAHLARKRRLSAAAKERGTCPFPELARPWDSIPALGVATRQCRRHGNDRYYFTVCHRSRSVDYACSSRRHFVVLGTVAQEGRRAHLARDRVAPCGSTQRPRWRTVSRPESAVQKDCSACVAWHRDRWQRCSACRCPDIDGMSRPAFGATCVPPDSSAITSGCA